MNVLNCNHIDGNLITERTAKSIFFGIESTIEDAYNNARRTITGDIAGVDNFHHLHIKGVDMPLEDAGCYYEALWFQFLAENKDLYYEIVKYDDFIDLRDASSMNSTARVFKILKMGGITGLKTHCKGFLERLNKKIADKKRGSDSEQPSERENLSFNDCDNMAKHLVKFNYKSMYKSEILELAKETNNDIVVKLTSLRYDEFAKEITPDYFKTQYFQILSEYNKKNQIGNDSNVI